MLCHPLSQTFVASSLLGFMMSSGAFAALALTGNTAGAPATVAKEPCPAHTAWSNHCDSTVSPDPVTKIASPSAWFQGVLAAEYGAGWTFNYVGANDNMKGKLDVAYYRAYNDCPGKLGSEIRVDYIPDADSPIKDIYWIQGVKAVWSDGSNHEFVDDKTPPAGYSAPAAGSNPMPGPFYPYQDEDTDAPLWQSGQQYDYFYDKPGSPCPSPGTTETFLAECYASFVDDFIGADGNWVDVGNDGHNVYIHEGYKWGFTLTCVPEPTTAGVFLCGLLAGKRRSRSA